MVSRKKRSKKTRIRISETSEDDFYLSRIDARMTRLALRLDRKRHGRWYIV